MGAKGSLVGCGEHILVRGSCPEAPYFVAPLLSQPLVPYDIECPCHPLSPRAKRLRCVVPTRPRNSTFYDISVPFGKSAPTSARSFAAGFLSLWQAAPTEPSSRNRPCLQRVVVHLSAPMICEHWDGWFSPRGLSPHSFTPMPGVHNCSTADGRKPLYDCATFGLCDSSSDGDVY